MLSVDDLRALVDAADVDTVSICTPDLYGRLMGKRVPARSFLERLPHGVEIASAIYVYDAEQNVHEGFPGIGEAWGWADMEATPDLATLRRLGHLPRAALVFADVGWPDGSAMDLSPRHVLQQQASRAAERGLTPVAAIELEFHLLQDTYEEARDKGYRGLRPVHATMQDYGLYRAHRDDTVLGALWRAFEAAGVAVDTVKTEMGHGQYEITFHPTGLVEAADRAALAKLITREVAAQHGLAATFMARLHHLGMGNSGHVHVSLADAAGVNLFDPDGHELAALGRSFAGGLMRRAPELMVVACPYVNSYKRLDPANFVTAALDFRHEARTVPVRVCGHGPSRNIEYRIPGADANPYLVLAAVLAAGLEGIETGAEPFTAGSATAGEVGDLPADLAAAAARWEASEWARETFGERVVQTLAVAARHELAEMAREVSDIELRRGFEWA
jgi:glutamine synthetase